MLRDSDDSALRAPAAERLGASANPPADPLTTRDDSIGGSANSQTNRRSAHPRRDNRQLESSRVDDGAVAAGPGACMEDSAFVTAATAATQGPDSEEGAQSKPSPDLIGRRAASSQKTARQQVDEAASLGGSSAGGWVPPWRKRRKPFRTASLVVSASGGDGDGGDGGGSGSGSSRGELLTPSGMAADLRWVSATDT